MVEKLVTDIRERKRADYTKKLNPVITIAESQNPKEIVEVIN